MLTNVLIVGSNTGFPVAGKESRAQGENAGGFTLFKDILNSRLSSGESYEKDLPAPASAKRTENAGKSTVDDQVGQKTFREYEKQMKVEAGKTVLQKKKGSFSRMGKMYFEIIKIISTDIIFYLKIYFLTLGIMV